MREVRGEPGGRDGSRSKRARISGLALSAGGAVIVAVVVTALLLLENLEDFPVQAALLSCTAFLLSGGLLYAGIKRFFKPPPPSRASSALDVAAVGLLAALVTTAVVLGVVYLPPEPDVYPRRFPIVVQADYKFSTQYGDLNDTVDALVPRNLPLPDDPSTYAWGESYYMRSLLFIYKATRDPDLLSELVERLDVILDNSDWNHDGVPGFGSDKYERDEQGNPRYVEYVVWDGMTWLPAVEVAREIRSSPSLLANATLKAAADRYVDAAERIIWKWNATHWRELDEYRGFTGPMGYYVSPPKNEEGKGIFNRINALGRMVLVTYQCTGNASYKTQVEKIARYFRANLVEKTYMIEGARKTTFVWGYDNHGENSDTSHACIDCEFVNMCFEAGIVFTAEDVAKFANALVDIYYRGRDYQVSVVYEGTNYTNVLAHRVDGSEVPYFFQTAEDGTREAVPGYYRNVRQGWLQFSPYYGNITVSTHVVFRVLEDLVRGGNLGSCVQQTLSWLRYATYVDDRFPTAPV
ncbi:MAG: hypothetical protein ACTSU5_13550 [Promethearchaeota archaeon]